MIIINLAVFFFLPFTLGALVVAAVSGKKASCFNIWERIAFSFPLGLGLLAITMYLLDLAGVPVTLINIAIVLFTYYAILIGYLLFTKALNRPFLSIPKPSFDLDWQERILFLLISLKVLFAFFSALVKPMIDVDAFQFYSIVAKGLYYKHTLLTPYISTYIGGKPPFPFLAQGWVLIGLQTTNDAWLKILSPILFISLLVLFYNVLRKSVTRKISLLFTFMLSSLPFLLYHTTTAYADVPVTFYFTVSCLYLFRFLKDFYDRPAERNYAPLAISLIMAAVTVWAKHAGLMLAGANILTLLIFLFSQRKQLYVKEIKGIASIIFILFLLITPLIVPRVNFLIGTLSGLTGHNDVAVQAIAKNVVDVPISERTVKIGQIFTGKLFLYSDWHLTWALLLVSLLFFFRRALAVPQRYLLCVLVLAVMSVFVQFESSGVFVWLLDGTLFDRLVMNEVPLALFVSAQIIGHQ